MSTDIGERVDFVVLTLDEEETLAGCLASLSWCSSVHVLDSGSTDATTEIARAAGATVTVHRSDGPFLISDQRNWALDHLELDREWVMFLDADEESTPEFVAGLGRALDHAAGADALLAAPAFWFHDRWIRRISGYPNWHPRGVRRGSRARFAGGVWETFTAESTTHRVDAPYRHFPDAKGLADWTGKHVRYAQWEAKQIQRAVARRAVATSRRRALRNIRYRLGPLRKWANQFYLLVLRRGLLDGPAAWAYARRMYLYDVLIDRFVEEIRFEAHRRRSRDSAN